MSIYYWVISVITNNGTRRNIHIKENAETPSLARNNVCNNIVLLSRYGIPRLYLNGEYIWLSHSNDARMNGYDFVNIDSIILRKLLSSTPDIIPDTIKQQGLNHNAAPFYPTNTNTNLSFIL